MIPALIIWLFKKYILPAFRNKTFPTVKFLKPLKRAATILALLGLAAGSAAQEQTVKYNVLHSGKVVGHLNLYRRQQGDELYLKMISQVKMRFIFSVKVDIQEESMFSKGKLINSTVCRHVNDKEKCNRQTRAVASGYQTVAEGKCGKLDQQQIGANLMLLYCREPDDQAQVYSDNFQQFLQVKQVSPHVYRIDLPDGNYNFYSYTNGVCSKVDIHHTLYTIQIQPA
ncbi:hypothetical protein LX99_03621 [Mucilaginibacter oryzae]|uniref:Uncharacterized protein n=1 Tax=Mucilaginibacter oryzae TaxID=468058 RepID=A0A316H665_9SPHI|nr:DUF6134 family protein [Mucilaginibacter oryzae]PWK75888.1 hypothetical protein LX99_03621 [Mucilaginibacter oryzae]